MSDVVQLAGFPSRPGYGATGALLEADMFKLSSEEFENGPADGSPALTDSATVTQTPLANSGPRGRRETAPVVVHRLSTRLSCDQTSWRGSRGTDSDDGGLDGNLKSSGTESDRLGSSGRASARAMVGDTSSDTPGSSTSECCELGGFTAEHASESEQKVDGASDAVGGAELEGDTTDDWCVQVLPVQSVSLFKLCAQLPVRFKLTSLVKSSEATAGGGKSITIIILL